MQNLPTRSREERIRVLRDAFHALMWITTRQLSQRLQPYGLTLPQFITLSALVIHKQPCTMRDLTNGTFQDPPTMTGIVDRLVKTKLVQRTRSKTDRRVVLVQATQAGVELIRRINDEIISDESHMYSHLSDDDLAALEQLLRHKLRLSMGQRRPMQDTDLDAEIDRLQRFMTDPIYYAKLENENKLHPDKS